MSPRGLYSPPSWTYIVGYDIEIADGDIQDLEDYGDAPRFMAGLVAFLWPLAIIAAILIFVYLTGCYYVSNVGDKIISRKERKRKEES